MRKWYIHCWLLAAALGLLSAGCDDDVVAVTGMDEDFTLYGVLSPQMDTQRVLVFPIREKLEPLPREPLGIRFTSKDLETGRVRSWNAYLRREEGGRHVHVFWAPFRAQRNHTYRIQAAKENANTAHAQVAVPPEVSMQMQEPVLRSSPGRSWLPITLPVRLVGAPRLLKVRAIYEIKVGPGRDSLTTQYFTFPYDHWQKQIDGELTVGINLRSDYEVISRNLDSSLPGFDPDYGIAISSLRLRLRVVNEEWSAPDNIFHPSILAQPRTLSNVKGGLGFVGAGYVLEDAWRPKDSSPLWQAIKISRFRFP